MNNAIKLKAQIARALLANHYMLALHIIEQSVCDESCPLSIGELQEYHRKAERLFAIAKLERFSDGLIETLAEGHE